MVLGDIGPDTLRRPGAMTLDILKGHWELKASEAPERRSEWKVMFEFSSFSFLRMRAKFFLRHVSVSGTQVP